MLKHSLPATAFFTGNSRITVMFLRAIRAHKDIRPALVAFDDLELADMLRPGITVVAQDGASMGRVAAELLFCRLGRDSGPTQRIYLRTTLIPRGSGEIPPSSWCAGQALKSRCSPQGRRHRRWF